MLTRRHLIAAALAAPLPALAAGKPVVTILGDSITAGFGLPASAAFPARLQAELAKLGRSAVIRPAGVSGDTTAGGLARVDFSVQKDTTLCIVALGGNDLLQGLKPGTTKANLDAIVRRLKARKIAVLLAGLAAPPAIGGGYAREFNAVFPAVAKAQGVAFYPNLLAGVSGLTRLNQRDGIHPNAQGAALIAQRLAPAVAKALA
ncbi:arylesterase [Phenylobacterium sp.]|uniref:arylesterase n=1 Tax=Phenylobacterium sp. TaxID=1871053 RepID=UPI00271CC837|nr:arylesterase [Phenylobacterium sp.]MDO8801985.1 arylesterase [Phenylobacterium sp.]